MLEIKKCRVVEGQVDNACQENSFAETMSSAIVDIYMNEKNLIKRSF